jgi:hypothetical protein
MVKWPDLIQGPKESFNFYDAPLIFIMNISSPSGIAQKLASFPYISLAKNNMQIYIGRVNRIRIYFYVINSYRYNCSFFYPKPVIVLSFVFCYFAVFKNKVKTIGCLIICSFQ